MADVIKQNKDFLTELDMPIGDSDHGINLARGFQAVVGKLTTLADKDAGTILKNVGTTLVSTVGGASGPLYGTAFMKAGAKMAGMMELGMDDLIIMLHEAVEGIKMRGKSTTGEQTMLDAMVPALEALKENRSLAGAGGLPGGEIGTDFERIYTAVESVMSDDGVAVLFDLGSALMTAEMVMEQFEEGLVLLADAPIVEGSVIASVSASMGLSLAEVVKEAHTALETPKV